MVGGRKQASRRVWETGEMGWLFVVCWSTGEGKGERGKGKGGVFVAVDGGDSLDE